MNKKAEKYRCVLANYTVGFVKTDAGSSKKGATSASKKGRAGRGPKQASALILAIMMLCGLSCVSPVDAAQNKSVAYDLFDDGQPRKNTPTVDEIAREREVNAASISQSVGGVEGLKYMQPIEIVGEGQKYTLGPDDVVQVTVRNQPDFSGYFVVGPEGHIQYNWCGDVLAEGLTKNELKDILGEKLKQYVRYPEVSVQIIEYNSKAVYVVGTVGKPGKYPMKGDHIKLRDALVAAGLPTDVSALGRARIIRETIDGPQSIEVDLADLLYEGQMDLNYELEPGDIVYVPMSRFVKTTQIMSQLFGPAFQAASVYSLAQDIGGDD